jgi:gas vesicle protein
MSKSRKKTTQVKKLNKKEREATSKLFTGLVIGFLAGSTSYFLFHSKQGQELKEDIKDKWEEAQKNLPTLKDLKIGDLSLSELASIVLGTNIEKKKNSKLKIKSSAKIGTRSKSKKPSKFKGS